MRSLCVLATLLCLITVSAISPQPVKANDPCHEACDQNYQLCLTNAQEGYDACEYSASWNLSRCEQQATNAYDNCMNIMWPWCSCAEAFCGWHLQEDLQDCAANYEVAEQACYDQLQYASENCHTAYTHCNDDCDP